MSKQTTQYLSQAELNKLSQDPRNKIYQYTYDNPTRKFSVEEQKNHIQAIRDRYVQLLDKSSQTDEEIREQLKQENPTWEAFIENHERIFLACTTRTTPPEHILHLQYMMYVKEQQELGNVDPITAQQMVQNYLVDSFKTNQTLEQYKAQMKKEKENGLNK